MVGEKDWEYKKTFIIKEKALNYNDILLNCKMLDTICDVLINDKLLFKGNNCFKSYSYSIKDFVEIGENELRIIFHSPVNYVSKKYEQIPAPINSNGQNGIVHIRKPQCHFGWDWGPVLPCSGITRDIELEFVEDGRINYLSVTQNHSDNITISVNADLTLYNDDAECFLTVETPDGEVFHHWGRSHDFVIENPKLWWTKELSGSDEQPLYTVKAVIFNNGKEICWEEKKSVKNNRA